MKLLSSLLASSLALLVSCSDKKADPTPPPIITTPIRTAMQHRVTMRYQVVSFGDAAQLPTTPARITVEYEPIQEFATGLVRAALKQEALVADASTATKEVLLSPIVTYNNTLKPRITITIQVNEVPPTGAQRGYRVPVELFVDGSSVGSATYSAALAAAQNPATPLLVKAVLEINH
jgi:hypothetical protein